MESITSLYGTHAELYELVANDRDFAGQVDWLVEELGLERPRVLELFAGPAYHGIELARRHGADVWCIDTAAEMRDRACASGVIARERVVIGALPAALDLLPEKLEFDLVLALRYSAGYLDTAEIDTLLGGIAARLRPSGVAVFELHRMDLALAGFDALAIRARKVQSPTYGEVTCTWPARPLRWRSDALRATMDVRIEIERTGACLEFQSEEFLHPAELVTALARRHRLVAQTPRRPPPFTDALAVILRRA